MIVEEVMVKKIVTIKTNDSLQTAQELMVNNSIRHLPVVEGKELFGIITESDIRGAFISLSQTSPEKMMSLNPTKMKVQDFMTRNPMTVTPETNIEDAALMIYKNKIGALPVVKNSRLMGIVSIMDILGLFVNMMGILHSSSRIDVVMGKDPKNFDAVSKIIHDRGLNIISVGMSPYPKNRKKQVYLFRLDLCETRPVVEEIENAGFKVVSAID
ncbi:MAG: CBS and ACT domain-containing protein [Nitrospinaceae bacterium]